MANSAFYTVLPQTSDWFVVDGPPALVTHSIASVGIVRCDVPDGIYICLRQDSTNNAVYAASLTGGQPGRAITSAYGEVPIPLAKIRSVVQAR